MNSESMNQAAVRAATDGTLKTPLVGIAGTWGLGDTWHRFNSLLMNDARDLGWFTPHEHFRWGGRLGGFGLVPDDPDIGMDDDGRGVWHSAAWALNWYLGIHFPGQLVDILAHSHAGQVASLAIAAGMARVRNLVTISTPIRKDMRVYRQRTRQRLEGTWIHVHGDFLRDRYSWMGALGWTWPTFQMSCPEADQTIHAEGRGHSDTLEPGFFSREIWPKLLRANATGGASRA